jgi:hypothetical protein
MQSEEANKGGEKVTAEQVKELVRKLANQSGARWEWATVVIQPGPNLPAETLVITNEAT